jgi:hypothetical protein
LNKPTAYLDERRQKVSSISMDSQLLTASIEADSQLPPFGVALVSHTSIGASAAMTAGFIGHRILPRCVPRCPRRDQIDVTTNAPTLAIAALLRAASPSVSVRYTVTSTGPRPGGHRIATSLAVP